MRLVVADTVPLYLPRADRRPRAAARKLLDAMWLQKISQQRQSNFVGLSSVPGAPSREKMLEDEKALVRQYGKEAAEKMRRNGFSGLSIEE